VGVFFRLFRDMPELRPAVSLEQGMREVIDAMNQAGRIPNADLDDWQDRLIATQQHVRGGLGPHNDVNPQRGAPTLGCVKR
jgi:hypothetical protein